MVITAKVENYVVVETGRKLLLIENFAMASHLLFAQKLATLMVKWYGRVRDTNF